MSMYDIGIVRRKRVTQQSSMMFGQSIAVSGFDAATLAWVAAVFAVDGTVVSTPQKTLVDNLIVGLKADGLFTKLDRLWLFAIENQTEALVDIVADSLATMVNSPTFTPDLGITGDLTGTPKYTSSNYNFSTNSVNYTQDLAHLSLWNLTSGTDAFDSLNKASAVPGINIFPKYTDNNCYTRINDNPEAAGLAISDPRGHIIGNRSGPTARQTYQNGASLGAIGSTASTAPPNDTLNIDSRQIAMVSIGGSLSPTDAANLYSRLLTYMAAAFTQRWVNTVISNGGTVSAGRQTLVNALINGLMTDGVWYKLDRLWLFAGENQGSALTDIVADSLATSINATAFVPDRGYTDDGATTWIDTNVNPSTAGLPNFTQNSASFFAWSNTSGKNGSLEIGGQLGNDNVEIIPRQGGTFFMSVNAGSAYDLTATIADSIGFYHANRSGASSNQGYFNGSSVATSTQASVALANANFTFCRSFVFGTMQVSCGGFGASLSSTDAANLYARLRTYMTAVGVT